MSVSKGPFQKAASFLTTDHSVWGGLLFSLPPPSELPLYAEAFRPELLRVKISNIAVSLLSSFLTNIFLCFLTYLHK